jgi:lipopolysaccharide assembly outer membrane protein LptD (OstA)
MLILFPAAALALLCFAAEPVSQKSPSATKLYIYSEGGAAYSPGEAAYMVCSNAVRVFDSEMYLECERLTLLQQTNRPARADRASLTNLNTQADTIIAETDLMVMARGTTLLGDRGVYTRSNETITITGNPVVIERSNLLFVATNFVFNRLTSSGYAVGESWTEVELSGSAFGTNAPKPGFAPRLRPNPAPVQPRNDGPK